MPTFPDNRTVIVSPGDGPAHKAHGPQRQVGWLHAPSGKVFAHDEWEACRNEEPFGSASPIYVDVEP